MMPYFLLCFVTLEKEDFPLDLREGNQGQSSSFRKYQDLRRPWGSSEALTNTLAASERNILLVWSLQFLCLGRRCECRPPLQRTMRTDGTRLMMMRFPLACEDEKGGGSPQPWPCPLDAKRLKPSPRQSSRRVPPRAPRPAPPREEGHHW